MLPYIIKVRNSLVHGRFFLDTFNQKCVFYDKPLEKVNLTLREKEKAVYAPYIEKGEAVDKVKNLTCVAEMSFANVYGILFACLEGDIKHSKIKKVVSKSSLVRDSL